MSASLRGAVLALLAALLVGLLLAVPTAAEAQAANPSRHCIAFGPHIKGYNAVRGPYPPPRVIDELLDRLVRQTRFRCIQTYGVLHGLNYTFAAAERRGLRVVAIIWLDPSVASNQASINLGIREARRYPNTIIRISCGSEMRTRSGVNLDGVISNCISRFRAARVRQPIGTIESWWEWCARSWNPCKSWGISRQVDWIGVAVYPWWENKYSGIFPCVAADRAADFTIARYKDVIRRYPGKAVYLNEFGWPGGPEGYREVNRFTGQTCGEAGEKNQNLVISGTLARLDRERMPQAVVFSAFREAWKQETEGPAGSFWGICRGDKPYTCKRLY